MITFTKVSLPYGWLGNMSPHPIRIHGQLWPTAEHLFQAQRFLDAAIKEEIRLQKSPMGAKMRARKRKNEGAVLIHQPRTPEDLRVMACVVGEKLDQHSNLVQALLDTGDEEIVEDVTRRASEAGLFWGKALKDGQWVGHNHLGSIWMEARRIAREMGR